MESEKEDIWKKGREKRKKTIGPPFSNQRYRIVYPQLEPGEVPSADYVPNFWRQHNGWASNYNEQPMSTWSGSNSAAVVPNNQKQFPIFNSNATKDEEPGELWTPSSNPMKDVFESAKVGIKKLIENVKHSQMNNEDISRLLLLRPPPIRCQPQARKRKHTSRKAAPSYAGVIFNSKDAQMRHSANRWVKGGRLTTTGKFEESISDEDDDVRQLRKTEAEIGRTLRQLEATPAENDAREAKNQSKVQFHVVYEDTSEYTDYAKWYADLHGCAPSDVVDDEYQKYLRDWYRWYKTAVKFVDVEPLSDDEGQEGTSNEEQSRRLMEQWRWQQVNEWELKTKNQSAKPILVHETTTDGISFSGKPLAYDDFSAKDNAISVNII